MSGSARARRSRLNRITRSLVDLARCGRNSELTGHPTGELGIDLEISFSPPYDDGSIGQRDTGHGDHARRRAGQASRRGFWTSACRRRTRLSGSRCGSPGRCSCRAACCLPVGPARVPGKVRGQALDVQRTRVGESPRRRSSGAMLPQKQRRDVKRVRASAASPSRSVRCGLFRTTC